VRLIVNQNPRERAGPGSESLGRSRRLAIEAAIRL